MLTNYNDLPLNHKFKDFNIKKLHIFKVLPSLTRNYFKKRSRKQTPLFYR